ncbi:MAG: hypothetical protein HQL76_13010 [Magnetococcales bacterium]|nr:hypothetical protein [Magnetococcales bacterium]
MNDKLQIGLEHLPAMSVADAAWTAGIAVEAMERFLADADLSPGQSLRVSDLLQSAFHLLGFRQLQVELLSRQLWDALNRERELVLALQTRLDATCPPVTSAHANPATLLDGRQGSVVPIEPTRGKKKGGKKKKKEVFFP